MSPYALFSDSSSAAASFSKHSFRSSFARSTVASRVLALSATSVSRCALVLAMYSLDIRRTTAFSTSASHSCASSFSLYSSSALAFLSCDLALLSASSFASACSLASFSISSSTALSLSFSTLAAASISSHAILSLLRLTLFCSSSCAILAASL